MNPSPAEPGRALTSAMGALDEAHALLAEVDGIGLWSGSDDDSDNRHRRAGLREADWAVSRAHREIRECVAQGRELRHRLEPVEAELAELVRFMESLPELVSVTRDPNFLLSRGVGEARERVSAVHAVVAMHLSAIAPGAGGAAPPRDAG
jgi:hypothetical protein